jgi:hypothetical protein
VAKPINKTIIHDLGHDRIRKDFEALKNKTLTIGFFKDESPYENGQSVVQVAYWNEFGNERIPERSFIRSTWDEKRREWLDGSKQLMQSIVLGQLTPELALNKIGFKIATEYQNKIVTLMEPPNAPSTVARKPNVGNNPLINSRKMLRSVGFQVTTNLWKKETDVIRGGLS